MPIATPPSPKRREITAAAFGSGAGMAEPAFAALDVKIPPQARLHGARPSAPGRDGDARQGAMRGNGSSRATHARSRGPAGRRARDDASVHGWSMRQYLGPARAADPSAHALDGDGGCFAAADAQ